jgi:hypothetical protein
LNFLFFIYFNILIETVAGQSLPSENYSQVKLVIYIVINRDNLVKFTPAD